MDIISRFRQLTADPERTKRTAADNPDVKREVEYYLANITSVKSVDDFLKDTRLFAFAMNAFGLKDMIYAKAYMRKALVEGIDTPQSFSLRLADTRFREFVETFNFARYKDATTAFDRTQAGTVDRYLQNNLEERAGAQNEGLRLALYFQRKAPGLTNAYSILADKAIYTVVRTALGLPQAMSASDIDKQAATLTSRLDIDDFRDARKLDRFISRFLAQHANQNFDAAAAPAFSVLAGGGGGIDMQSLLSLQALKRFNS